MAGVACTKIRVTVGTGIEDHIIFVLLASPLLSRILYAIVMQLQLCLRNRSQ